MLTIFNRIIGAVALLIILTLLAIWAFSPLAVRQYAPPFLAELGLEMSESSSIRLNPFKGALTVNDFALSELTDQKQNVDQSHGSNKAVISHAVIDVSLLALVAKQLAFDELDFDDLSITIERVQSQNQQSKENSEPTTKEILKIAGYALPTDNPDNDEESVIEDKEQGSEPINWSLAVPELSIDNFTARVLDLDFSHEISLQNLSVVDLALAQNGLNGTLALSALLNEAPFKLDLEIALENEVIEEQETITGQVLFASSLDKLAGSAFSYLLKDQLNKLGGHLDFNLEGEVNIQANGIALALKPSYLEVQQLDLSLADAEVRESSLKLTANSLAVLLPNDGEISAEGEIALNGQNIQIGPSNSEDILLAIEGMEIPSLSFNAPSIDTLSASVNEVLLKEVRISQRISTNAGASEAATESPAINSQEPSELEPVQSDETAQQIEQPSQPKITIDRSAPLLELASLDISQIQYKPEALSIESIDLGALDARVQIDERQQISNIVSIREKSIAQEALDEAVAEEQVTSQGNNTSEVEADIEKEKAGSFNFALGNFALRDNGDITLIYEAMTPRYEQTFNIKTLILQKLNTQTPDEFSHLEISLIAGRYTLIDVIGELAPFADQVNMTLDVNVKELELPKISPFIRTAAGFDIANGQLDTKTKVAIVNDIVDGNSEIEIRGLEIDNVGDVQSGSLAESSFIPLNVALGALEDSDGRIELDVPIRGNVNNPNFGAAGFLNLVAQRAAIAASQSYVINTFVPYANIVTLTSIAGSYALKPRVADLIFEPGEYELNDEQKAFVDKLALLLKDKDDIDMQACGFAAHAEVDFDQKESRNPDEAAELRRLALDRATQVKNYLVDEKEIISSRILICKPVIDEQGAALPRVEFEF